MKEITMKQGVAEQIYLRSTFPITFGHCIGATMCHIRKYSFTTAAMEADGMRQNDCQIRFENPLGDLVYKSSTPINIVAQITPGEEHSKHFLSFKPFSRVGDTLLRGYVISPVQVCCSTLAIIIIWF